METVVTKSYKRPNYKPVVSYWKTGDPCMKMELLKKSLTDITIIRTKRLTEDLINLCLEEKARIYLHFVISGLNASPLEPKIPTVKESFFQLKKLVDKGFSQSQILVVIDPILPNFNGLTALKLMLRVFTEFKELRLRFVRFNLMTYKMLDDGRYIPNIEALKKRQGIDAYTKFLIRTDDFTRDYYKLIDQYRTIISIDKGEEALIGIRELMGLGFRNEWNNEGKLEKIIEYEQGNRFKPIVNVISGKPLRCANRCVLCRNFG